MKAEAIEPRGPALWWVLGAAIVTVLPHALRLSPWLSLAFAALLAWRYAINQRGWYRPGLVVRLLLALVLAGAVFRDYGTLLGRDPGTALLVVLTGIKLLESRTLRDYMLTVFLLYLLIATDFLYSQSLLHGFYLVAATGACTQALVLLNRRHPRPLSADVRLVFGLLLKAVPLMLVMYVLFPRIEGGLWRLPSDAFGATTGLTNELQPGTINHLNQSDALAFRVQFHGQRPPRRDLYWRALVMWHTDGRDWRPGPRVTADSQPAQETGIAYRYTITLEPTHQNWLVALDLPVNVPSQARRKTGFLLRARSPVNQRLQYQLISQAQYRTGPLPPAQRRAGLELPATTSARVRALAQSWRRKNTSPKGVVQAALAYFHNQDFIYTLTPPLLGKDPVDEFLFDTRAGYCEHYATAFVTLMRAAGIPARVVVGYQGGEYNKIGHDYIVRQADAHAWAEVWLAGQGWTRVDPTAAVAPARIEYGIDALRQLQDEGVPLGELHGAAFARAMHLDALARMWMSTRMYLDFVNLEWYRWISDYGPGRQQRLLRALGMLAPTWLGRLAGLAGAVVLLTLAIAWWMGRRRTHDPVRAAYERFCRKLGRAGIPRHTWEGARDYATRVRRMRPDLDATVEGITALYIRLRYGEEGGAEQLRELRRRVRTLRAQSWRELLRRT